MQDGFWALIVSLGAVTVAEMGDKTQLLAMAFAAKYKMIKVLIGVFIATVLNHALAVAFGSFIARYDTIKIWVQIIAALSFIFFGLWTIRGDKLEGEENRVSRFGAVTTVSIAFFFAELGDKTQLATIALAAKFPLSPLFILIGTTAGMLIADTVGIFIGVVLSKKIPERTIKLISAGAFILFGLIGSYQAMREQLNFSFNLSVILIAILTLISIATSFWLFLRDSSFSKK